MNLEQTLRDLGMQGVVRRGHNVMACCPNHDEQRPSWGMKDDYPFLHACFSCGYKGTLVYLLQNKFGRSKEDAEAIAGGAPEQETFSNLGDINISRKYLESSKLFPLFENHPDKNRYLYKRGFSGKELATVALYYDPRQRRVVFPHIILGKLTGATGRAIDENNLVKTLPYFNTKKGESLYIPSFDKRCKKLVLVEGEIDALKVHFATGLNVAAMCYGIMAKGQEKLIHTLSPKEIILCFDNDEAGGQLTRDCVERLGKSVTTTYMPYDGKDPGEAARESLVSAYENRARVLGVEFSLK